MSAYFRFWPNVSQVDEEQDAVTQLVEREEEQDREREETPVKGEPDLVITGTKGFVGLFLVTFSIRASRDLSQSDHNSSFNVKVELPTFPGFQAMGQVRGST